MALNIVNISKAIIEECKLILIVCLKIIKYFLHRAFLNSFRELLTHSTCLNLVVFILHFNYCPYMNKIDSRNLQVFLFISTVSFLRASGFMQHKEKPPFSNFVTGFKHRRLSSLYLNSVGPKTSNYKNSSYQLWFRKLSNKTDSKAVWLVPD